MSTATSERRSPELRDGRAYLADAGLVSITLIWGSTFIVVKDALAAVRGSKLQAGSLSSRLYRATLRPRGGATVVSNRESGVENALTSAAIADLKRHGLRLTPQRLMILELLERASGHIAPEDIYHQVHQRYPMINRSTVHRTLDVLEELGMVRHGHVADGAARYHLSRDVHHLHLVCHRCGHALEIDELSVADPFAARLLERFGFRADLTHFPISGLCAACANGAPSPSR